MSKKIKITIDGKTCEATEGQYLVDAASDNGIYIPTLCNIVGEQPRSSCRICTCKVNGRLMTSCTTPVIDGMVVENNTPEIEDMRRAIIELMFVEGNHFCPTCEKSGNCDLQALGYRLQMLIPRFPYMFPNREIDASHPVILMEHNRCILCKRCIRSIKDKEGRSIFAFKARGKHVKIQVDPELAGQLTGELAQKAMDICPVGTILVKETGFSVPIGKRKYDPAPIGSNIENK